MAKVYSNLMNSIFCSNTKYQMQKTYWDTWNKIALLSPYYALHANKITDKMSGNADCTLASAREEGQGKESREVEFRFHVQGRPSIKCSLKRWK